MSAGIDIVVNILDGAAFGLAGAEIFGKEKLRAAVEGVFDWSDKVMKRETEAAPHRLFIVKMVAVAVALSMLITWVTFGTSEDRTGQVISFYMMLACFFVVPVFLLLVGVSQGYRHLLTIYDQPRALLTLGAYLFLLARILAISSAWQELPSAAEWLHLDPPELRLGPEFEQWRDGVWSPAYSDRP